METFFLDSGGVSSNNGGWFTQKKKAGDFYDKSSGNHGFKEVVKYESRVKFYDKIQGYSTEYQTQVKFKRVTTYANKGTSKSSYLVLLLCLILIAYRIVFLSTGTHR